MILFRRMWKTLRLLTRKVVECYKQSLIGHLSRSLEDSSAESSVVTEAQLKRIQGGTVLVTDLEIIFVIFWQRM